MKLLLVTCRNIDKNGGENALIMGRHISLYHNFNVETDILFFHKDTTNIVEANYPGMQFLECKKENLYEKLNELLSSGEYQGVVVSGFYDKQFTKYIVDKKKEHGFVYIVDIHATIKEIYEYCIPDLYHILGTRYLYLKKKIRFVETLKVADFAFVVSDEEILEVNRFWPGNNIKFVKIRCGCYDSLNRNEYFEKREKQRALLNISPDTLAFVYSGSKDRWQKFEDTIKLYKDIKTLGNKCVFAFYMNLDEKSKNELYDELGKENVIVRWVTPTAMKEELTAYDVGVMLRDYKWTNRVAFPNKFSDYIFGGLNLVLSEAVVEPYQIVKKYNLTLFNSDNIQIAFNEISTLRSKHLAQYIETCSEIVDSELLYDAQVKNNCSSLVDELRKRVL